MAAVGCSSAAAADMQVGDCLEVGGPPDRPEANKVGCGSHDSNFKVVATVESTDQCPADVDSYYSMRSSFNGSGATVCMDIDWVVGGCMSVDPNHDRDPIRVDCRDAAAPNRQRATQIMQEVANVDQCATGLGYAYDQRQFTVCVEDVS
ncbi:LppU family putative lipoprotein [Mycolicibacterium hodleri]|uniref:Lipoprotein LppU n=1 Tax=Mycolicibacterium hodleri TaxID=49897 RepID=A0A502EK26_9MYCO|nr:hypothetical protein [Mycolicibacterium hodleri]TPG37409.1 hypothetical protein EAH80_03595 [Mycolicibacterium hodleri]